MRSKRQVIYSPQATISYKSLISKVSSPNVLFGCVREVKQTL